MLTGWLGSAVWLACWSAWPDGLDVWPAGSLGLLACWLAGLAGWLACWVAGLAGCLSWLGWLAWPAWLAGLAASIAAHGTHSSHRVLVLRHGGRMLLIVSPAQGSTSEERQT